jgi:DNA-binding NarL/FixJ family response regulator
VARIRLLIVDSHELVRAGLRSLLASEPEIEVVAEATSGHHAVAQAREHHPDVVLLEARLPDEDGAETCRLLHALTPKPALGILTDQADDASVRACVRAGAQGYLLKQVSGADLRRAVRALADGEGVIDPRIAPLVLAAVREAAANHSLEDSLNGRRRTILRLVAEGWSNREIAAQTQLSELTVKGYVEDILATLGARNRVQAAVLAIRRGLI